MISVTNVTKRPLVEGLVNHHVLGLRHVRAGNDQTWSEIGFIVLGAALVALENPPLVD